MEKFLVKTLYEDENNILNHYVIINSRNQTFTQYLLTTKDVKISIEIDKKDLRDIIIHLKASWEDWERAKSMRKY